jgi:hypothetical protein
MLMAKQGRKLRMKNGYDEKSVINGGGSGGSPASRLKKPDEGEKIRLAFGGRDYRKGATSKPLIP